MTNGIMMQYFEWYFPADGTLWNKITSEAAELSKVGITALWLPPAYKGQSGMNDVGYGVYDLYDLGEFDQKGTISTKYGTRNEYLNAIKELQKENIAVYADIVLNHKMGADSVESVKAVENNPSNRLEVISEIEDIEAWTRFTFPGRNGKYSDFIWNYSHFDGVDYDQRSQKCAIYNFEGSSWESDVDSENINYDYLMGADLNFKNKEVLEELDRWGQWYLEMTNVDGFRLDAVKHISFGFYKKWLEKLRKNNQKELFAVGEYWSLKLSDLQNYLRACEGCMSLFDIPLHMNFHYASNSNGQFDMARLLDDTLVKDNPSKAVTFVENHDTQAGQALETVVAEWFKPLAYAVILLRTQGYPCIFYGDYYGIPSRNLPGEKEILDLMCEIRRDKIYGVLHDYFDHPDVVGWTVEGDEEHLDSGAAILITDGPGGIKRMYMGLQSSGVIMIDVTGNQKQEVVISEDGYGDFTVDGGNLSIWIRK